MAWLRQLCPGWLVFGVDGWSLAFGWEAGPGLLPPSPQSPPHPLPPQSAAVTAAPSGGRPPLELPPQSRLQPERPQASAPPDAAVALVGSTTVHAILVAQWLRAPGETGAPSPSFQLLLVPQSAALLPHFRGAPLKYIDVANGREMLARATSQEIAREFDARQRGVVHVEGLFSIRGLAIGHPCLRAAQAQVTDVDPIRVRFPARPEPISCPS